MIEKTLSVLIIEDDLSFAIELDMLVKEIGYQVSGRIDNSEEALHIIFSETPDLILMDNDINGDITGIELAEQIKHLSIPILFITSFGQAEYYERAKLTNNFMGYLVKPINKISLRSSIQLAMQALEQNQFTNALDQISNNQNLFFKKRGVYNKVSIKEILLIQADGDYTITFTEKGSFISSIRLNEIENLVMKEDIFLRIHRSYIVNLSKVESIDPKNNRVHIGKHCIPFSRRLKTNLMKNMRLLK